jgi:hypothetical protein
MDNMQPTMIIDANGDKTWRVNGFLHRTDGPAREWADDTKAWYFDNSLHRTDGPAVEWPDGHKTWWLYGRLYSFDDWLDVNKNLTHEQKVMMKLQYG